MDTRKDSKNILANGSVQTLIASLFCILLGLVVGYIVLFMINSQGAGKAITAILKNFLYFPRPEVALEYFGSTLAKTAPLLMCTLSVLFAYKVGLFNIGASGQFSVGAGFALYFAIHYDAPWWVCILLAMAGGALLGMAAGALKAYLNVNEVIACIMLNWISLYAVNTVLTAVKRVRNHLHTATAHQQSGSSDPTSGPAELICKQPLCDHCNPVICCICHSCMGGFRQDKIRIRVKGNGSFCECGKVRRYERKEKHYPDYGYFRRVSRTGSRIFILKRY